MINQTLSRQAASAVNPLISEISVQDTLSQVSSLVSEIGHLVSLTNQNNHLDTPLGNLYLITNCIAAALSFESENTGLI